MLDTITTDKLHFNHPTIVALRADVQAHIATREMGEQGFSRELQERMKAAYDTGHMSHKALGEMLGVSKPVVWRAVNVEYEKLRAKDMARERKATRATKERTLPLVTAARILRVEGRANYDPAWVASMARALEERNQRLAREYAMTPAQILMGDPPPGRSALDQRNANRENQP